MAVSSLSPARIDEVVGLLGFAARPEPDLEGLESIYRAWCRRVPFDNLRKFVALQFRMPEIPGIDPADFFAAWQFTGAGATCWGGNNALHALLSGLGFGAQRFKASMSDGEVNHGTTIVTIESVRWLVDTAMHSDQPLPLVEGQAASVDHHGYVTSVRPDPGGWLVLSPTTEPDSELPCRIHGEMDQAFTEAANEKSRGWSPFNTDVMAQINDDHGSWLLKNGSLTRIDRAGTSVSALTSAEVDEFLVEVVGHSAALVAEVRAVLS